MNLEFDSSISIKNVYVCTTITGGTICGTTICGISKIFEGGTCLASLYLGIAACACDSKCLGGKVPAYYLNTGSTISYNSFTDYKLSGSTILSVPSRNFANGNLALGCNALISLTTAQYDTAIGNLALCAENCGGYNTAVGYFAGGQIKNGGYGNTVVGYETGYNIGGGGTNTAIGEEAMKFSSGAGGNVAIGSIALMNGTKCENTAVGTSSLTTLSSGLRNVAIGFNAGGLNVTGSCNTFIGHCAGYNEMRSCRLYITNSCTSNPLIYGEFNNNFLKINGCLTITGTTCSNIICSTTVVKGTVVSGSSCIESPVIQLTTGAAAGCVFTSNATGCGIWCTPSGGGMTWSGTTVNGVGTYVSATCIKSNSNMTFDGTKLGVTGNICASTCLCSPIVLGTTCVQTALLCSTGQVKGTILTGSTCVISPIICANTCFIGSGAGLTGTAASLTAGSSTNALCLGGNLANTYAPLATPVFTGNICNSTIGGALFLTRCTSSLAIKSLYYANDLDNGTGDKLYLSQGGGDDLRFKTNTGLRMTITTCGFVGINCCASNAPLTVAGCAYFAAPTLGCSCGTFLLLSCNCLYGKAEGVSSNGDTWFQSQRFDANATVYSINLQPAGGNVGIGISGGASPVFQFHVAEPFVKTDTSLRQMAFFGSCEAAASSPWGLRFSICGAATIANRVVQLQTTEYNVADNGNIILQPAAGCVGIGTSTPAYKFVVSNAGNLGFEIDPTAGAGTNVNILTYDRVASAYKPLQIHTSCLCLPEAGNMSVNGCIIVSDVVAGSDFRIKKCIQPIICALSTIMKLQGVSYIRCNDENNENQIGLIAQDTLVVLPAVVSCDKPDVNDFKYGIHDIKYGIKYDKIVAVLIEAIKTLKEEVDENKKEIHNLCFKLNYMRNNNKE